mmetsp:Transcript_292/g.966  ORF Transcript_292/g.966 Transcript_292/m.966 type:complete len:397 (+) Transcript_292:310-1500(+)
MESEAIQNASGPTQPPKKNKLVLKVKKGALKLKEPQEGSATATPQVGQEQAAAHAGKGQVNAEPDLLQATGREQRDTGKAHRKSSKLKAKELDAKGSIAKPRHVSHKAKKLKKKAVDASHTTSAGLDLLLMATQTPSSLGARSKAYAHHEEAATHPADKRPGGARPAAKASRPFTPTTGRDRLGKGSEVDISREPPEPEPCAAAPQPLAIHTTRDPHDTSGAHRDGETAAVDDVHVSETHAKMFDILKGPTDHPPKPSEKPAPGRADEMDPSCDAGVDASMRWLNLMAADAEDRLTALKESRERFARASLGVPLFEHEGFRTKNLAAVEATEEMLRITEAAMHQEEGNLDRWLEQIAQARSIVRQASGSPPGEELSPNTQTKPPSAAASPSGGHPQ